MATSTLTKQELTDAAVAVIEKRVAEVVRGEDYADEYTEAYAVTATLIEAGMLSHEYLTSSNSGWRDDARRSLDAKVKRLLDQEAAKPDARILRFSSRDHSFLPRLDGQRRGLYGNAVGYTTPELYMQAVQAVQARLDRERSEDEAMEALLARAAAAGLPAPDKSNRQAVTYSADALRLIVERVELLKHETNYLVTGEEAS